MISLLKPVYPRINSRSLQIVIRTCCRCTSNMAATDINLTPAESLIRDCLLDCRNSMRDEVPGMANLELRFAGGWVRDKLLGKPSHDIDVALSTMTGEQFGEALHKYMRDHEQGYLEQAQARGCPAVIKGLHKIKKNPELSKNLETVNTKIFGLDMDFVNLRKEVYDEVSRNPIMEFGTPEEDAVRRDATVNALFYNLDTKEIEDYTGRGLEDMQNCIMRTPLEPYQTFKDDPLRVLRLIRFASRLGYQIEPAVYEAMKDARIHAALKVKISRERVGVEVLKIMDGPDPLTGLNYIYDRDLYGVVFADPVSDHYPNVEQIPKIYDALHTLLSQDSILSRGLRLMDDQALCWFLGTYVPWCEHGTAAVVAARESIKAPNTLTKILADAIRYRRDILKIVVDVNNGATSRSSIGMLLKNAGGAWRSHVLYSFLCDLAEQESNVVITNYTTFVQYLQQSDLMDADKIKPLLNGNEIKTAMQITKAGPWLKKAIDVVVEWQFDHPQGSAQEAQAMLLDRKDEIQNT